MEPAPTSRADEARLLRTPINSLLSKDRPREALDLCKRVRPDYPDDPWLATMQAYLHVMLGENRDALAMADSAVRLGSTDPTVVLVMGAAHSNLGNHVEAVEALTFAQERFPQRIDVACMLLQEATASYGIDRARPFYAKARAQISDRLVDLYWAQLLFAAGLDKELPAGWVSAPIASVPAWVHAAGERLAFEGPREDIPIEDPVVAGGPVAPFKARVPGYTPYACTLRDATIFYRSNIILAADGAALNDTVADLEFGRFIAFDQDTAALAQRPGHVLLDVGQFQVSDLDAGIMLSGCASQHYGHWVGEYLSRLHYLQQHPRFAELPIIVDADMPPQHLEYLRLLAPNPIVQITAGGGLRCRELIVAGNTTFFPVNLTPDHAVPPERQGGFSIDCIQAIRRRVRASLPPPEVRDRKLYLSRQGRGARRPLNEDEIRAALTARGFEVVFTESMSIEAQVRLFQSARAIVAPNGSAALNAIFASTDVALFILSQRGLFNWGTYYGVMRELDYDMTFVVSEEALDFKHADYVIPLDRLTAALERSGL